MLSFTQGYHSAVGTVLRRKISAEGDIFLNLFLKGFGRLPVFIRGGGRGSVRFGGATEPLVWGNFEFYKSGKSERLILRSADIKYDALKLRNSKDVILTAFNWAKMLITYLDDGRADDKLLSCLFWCLKLLEDGVPIEVADWRFVWRWLNIWGLAPEHENEIMRFIAHAGYNVIRKYKKLESPELSILLRNAAERYRLYFKCNS
jgi:DNA repair protein RecO (recombination protein O)